MQLRKLLTDGGEIESDHHLHFSLLSSPPPSTLLLSFLLTSHSLTHSLSPFPFLPFSPLPALHSQFFLCLLSPFFLLSSFFPPLLPPSLFLSLSPFPISLFHFFLELSRYQRSKASYIAHLPL